MLVLIALALPWAPVPAAVAIADAPIASDSPRRITLGARMRATGRAECGFVRFTADPLSSRPLRTSGRVMLELPDRARLDFAASGERITLRSDGGEWLEPKLRQLVVFNATRAAGARRWWQLLMDGAAPDIVTQSRPGRRLVFRSQHGTGPDSASIRMDSVGLPIRLLVFEGESTVEFVFSGWRFGRPLGPAAYRQQAPAEFERIEMP